MRYEILLKEIASGKDYPVSLPCLIGRSKNADLQLTDPTISQRHAEIYLNKHQIWIQDLGSTNGTFVNGEKITEKEIHPGDSIQLGHKNYLVVSSHAEEIEGTVILHSLGPDEVTLDQKRLELVYAVTTELPEGQNIKGICEKIFARFKDFFKQDRGYIAIYEKDGSLEPLYCTQQPTPMPISRSIKNRIFTSGESFVLTDALAHDSFKEQESIITMHIRSAMCAPLIFNNQIYGLIYLDRNIPGVYSESDLELFRNIAAIIAPLIENARLWGELQDEYNATVEKLRKTEARLIDAERIAAYSRLGQAMAHEIRNPLTTLGGLLRRFARSESQSFGEQKCKTVLQAIERIERVLKEVDGISQLLRPKRKLSRIDSMVQKIIETKQRELEQKQIRPNLSIKSTQVMVPVDKDLLKKAISIIFREILLVVPKEAELPITLQDVENGLQLCFGNPKGNQRFGDPFAPEFSEKPWCNNLFLNIAHKILSDHGGRLLLNIEGHSILPLILHLPRSITVKNNLQVDPADQE